MNPRLEIFSQGEEIVTGQVVDTNSAWLSQQAVEMGFTVTRHTAVGDKLEDLISVLQDVAKRTDCCICTGGLGPTTDDLTAEAVAKAFDLPLIFDEIAFGQIQQFFSNRNRIMPECNRKQALLPKGSLRLDNTAGTASGFALQVDRCWFCFVPGVPSEMKHLFSQHIQPLLLQKFILEPNQLITIRTIGIGESSLQDLLSNIDIPQCVQLGFRAELGEVQTKLLFPANYSQAELKNLIEQITAQIGDAVYAVNGLGREAGDVDLISVLDNLMTTNEYTIAIAETVNQGLLAAKLVGLPWLLSSHYEQSNMHLAQQLNINYLDKDPKISAETIAYAVQKKTDADMVLIQLTGNSKASNILHEKSCVIQNGLLTKKGFNHETISITGDIKRKQSQAALASLNFLRKKLQGQM
ncbi:MAG: molybdopterin-binding protein [Methyloglobulus sp.]|nr:competence/damage-inducible protein A [Methyloglobulus sp.]